MLDLRVHFLEADGSLAPWHERIREAVRETAERVGAAVSASDSAAPIDVLVEYRAGETIPELGVAGACYRRALVFFTVDPGNENFEASLSAGEVRKLLTHELHHSFRHATCGYGSKLGEALVSEGLADAFDAEINGGDGHVWNHALNAADWESLLERAERELWAETYDHAGWFFGTDRSVPRWAGYTIGYHLVKTYLAVNPQARPSQMTATPASVVIGEAWAPLKDRLLVAA
ncbi:DUF2268 domain-containing putative Zn-dependent protease [Ensifer adhaerens]|uniref:DUF2268 domain-containing putative Zn-dependent protease n=1 Tax=Ensifer adhaerens TaxID=106592 RepID=UPI001446BD30|nr:DUF2268 domain-containing putative Zn-dependent protease [Ensifer adhaerens]MDF8352966.1 DUF2268 domain-containing putative Zn-dependent protease [Ensifer adhaerens]